VAGEPQNFLLSTQEESVSQPVGMGCTIIIPVYCAEENLVELHARLTTVLRKLAFAYEILFVEDGGEDGSWDIILKLAQQDTHVRGLRHARNYGQHNALLTGIRAARGDVIVTMDDDLQHPPEYIPALLSKLEEGFDVVYGTPDREQHELWRNLASQWIKLMMQMSLGIPIARQISALRAFRTHLRDAFANYNSSYVSIDVLLTWGTTRFAAVPIPFAKRTRGKSGYTFRRLLAHTFNMLTGFSTLPLRLASLLGFGFMIFGLAVLLYVLGRFLLEGTTVAGFPFLASIIAIFGGVQLFALGILGEYLARVFIRTMGKPAAVVRDRVGFSKET